jgi:hypothetical protein
MRRKLTLFVLLTRKWRDWQTNQLEGLGMASDSHFSNNLKIKD